MRKTKKVIIYSLGIAICLSVILILITNSFEKKQVMTVAMPNSSGVIELWEKPLSFVPIFPEYETWFVYVTPDGTRNWHLIDDQYITFYTVRILASTNYEKIRIETTGKEYPSHMIAEYNVADKSFVAKSEASVEGLEGWHLLAKKTIRD